MARSARFERATPTFGGLYSDPAELRAHLILVPPVGLEPT